MGKKRWLGERDCAVSADGAEELAASFEKANVTLSGCELSLWSDQIKEPEYVRYAFSPVPDMVLFNKEGLPASPFTNRITRDRFNPIHSHDTMNQAEGRCP